MSDETTRAWEIHHARKGRVEGALAVAEHLTQPELAAAGRIVLRYIEESGEAYAALERALMEDGRTPESLEAMNRAFWSWAQTVVMVASS